MPDYEYVPSLELRNFYNLLKYLEEKTYTRPGFKFRDGPHYTIVKVVLPHVESKFLHQVIFPYLRQWKPEKSRTRAKDEIVPKGRRTTINFRFPVNLKRQLSYIGFCKCCWHSGREIYLLCEGSRR